MAKKFKVIFTEEARKDYKKLDGSIKKLIKIAIAKMELRADEMGEDLTSKHGLNLIGCRKIKFLKPGIRMVYRIVGDQAEIAEIIVIGKREDSEVYQEAYERLKEIKIIEAKVNNARAQGNYAEAEKALRQLEKVLGRS